MSTGKNILFGAEGFVIGGLLGGAIALLAAPQSGTKTRYDIRKYSRFARLKKKRIISDAREQSKEMLKRAEEIVDKTKAFASGKYNGTVESFEKEILSLKAGFNKALETYKNYSGAVKPTDSIVDEIFIDFDDGSIPNRGRMSRRTDLIL